MEGGMTYGRNTLVRSVNTRVPDDVTEETIQELISKSYAGGWLRDNMRHLRPEIRKILKGIKGKRPAKIEHVSECLRLLDDALKEYKRQAADMSIASAREVTVIPKTEIKAEQPTIQGEQSKDQMVLEFVEFAEALDALGEVILFGSGCKVDNTQEIRGIGLLLTILSKQLHNKIEELEEAA